MLSCWMWWLRHGNKNIHYSTGTSDHFFLLTNSLCFYGDMPQQMSFHFRLWHWPFLNQPATAIKKSNQCDLNVTCFYFSAKAFHPSPTHPPIRLSTSLAWPVTTISAAAYRLPPPFQRLLATACQIPDSDENMRDLFKLLDSSQNSSRSNRPHV